MKRNQAYVLLVGLLIVVLFLAGLYWSTNNSPQSTSLPPTESDILNENIASGSLQAQQFTQSQLKQLYGEEYPLLLGPIDKQYKLKGMITDVIIADEVLANQFTSRAHAQFEYLDYQNNKQIIKVPLVVDNLQTNQSVFLLGRVAEQKVSEDLVRTHIKDELGFQGSPMEFSLSFARPRDEGDIMLSENILRDMINTLHPDGFEQFVETGKIGVIGNIEGWLAPIYISNSI